MKHVKSILKRPASRPSDISLDESLIDSPKKSKRKQLLQLTRSFQQDSQAAEALLQLQNELAVRSKRTSTALSKQFEHVHQDALKSLEASQRTLIQTKSQSSKTLKKDLNKLEQRVSEQSQHLTDIWEQFMSEFEQIKIKINENANNYKKWHAETNAMLLRHHAGKKQLKELQAFTEHGAVQLRKMVTFNMNKEREVQNVMARFF